MRAVIDLLVKARVSHQVVPIEVKAGKSGSLESLQQFVLNKHADVCIRFDLNHPEIGRIIHSISYLPEVFDSSYDMSIILTSTVRI
ncbi:MAG: hypothetical protein JRF56_12370 [Deltaproteobacteria bacterium]|nr:hypothetical protein [Deltaproteobacteria bacterium]